MSTKRHRCNSCHTDPCIVDTHKYRDIAVCTACDDEAEAYWVCRECGERECADGADECIACICDQITADPREIDGVYGSLLEEVVRELGRRSLECGSMMTMRQAS